MATRLPCASVASGAKSSNPAQNTQILYYPLGNDGIPIQTVDYMCLAKNQLLNDVIINFYLKHLFHDVLTPRQREKTHIFDTFFYTMLTAIQREVKNSSNPHAWDSNLNPAQKRHARVKMWTKNVNIFEKDYIVVPINESYHWFVAIICYPSLDGYRSMIDNRLVTPQEIKRKELNKKEPIKQSALETSVNQQGKDSIIRPCILIFDSLACTSRSRGSRVVATLRDYLTCEYHAKISETKIFNKDNIKGSCPQIPQQNNYTDCGLYLLQYVEQFFKDPILDYALPIKQLASWFDEIVVTRKREEISNLLKTLVHKYNRDSHLALPDITFPTLNGKLIETEEQQEGAEGDKGNSIKSHKSEGKESETPTLKKRNLSGGDTPPAKKLKKYFVGVILKA